MNPEVKDILLRIRASNNRLVTARRELGYPTPAAFARVAGVSYSSYVGLENFRHTPMGSRGWRPMAKRVSATLGIALEDLWPEHLRQLRGQEIAIEVDSVGLLPAAYTGLSESCFRLAAGPQREGPFPWTEDELRERLGRLRKRDAKAISLRYGLDQKGKRTLEEVGQILGLSKERVSQIIERGLDELRQLNRLEGMSPDERSCSRLSYLVNQKETPPWNDSAAVIRTPAPKSTDVSRVIEVFPREAEPEYPEITAEVLANNAHISDEQVARDITEMEGHHPRYGTFLDFLRRLQAARLAEAQEVLEPPQEKPS